MPDPNSQDFKELTRAVYALTRQFEKFNENNDLKKKDEDNAVSVPLKLNGNHVGMAGIDERGHILYIELSNAPHAEDFKKALSDGRIAMISFNTRMGFSPRENKKDG